MTDPTRDTNASYLRERLAGAAARLGEAVRGREGDWHRARQGLVEILKTLVIAFLLAQLIMVSVAQAFQVEQFSMEPTLLPHDRVLVSKFIYRLREPQRGDVIVMRYPRDPRRNYIKRVVAVEGDRVTIKNGRLFVNGREIPEAYLNGSAVGDYGPQVVPGDAVFVLGDNRNNSEDSRAFGAVQESLIVGQAILVYWPPQRLKLLFEP